METHTHKLMLIKINLKKKDQSEYVLIPIITNLYAEIFVNELVETRCSMRSEIDRRER